MRKRDINGNTVSTNRRYLQGVIRNMPVINYHMDSAGYILIDTPDGGHIIFHSQQFPRSAEHCHMRRGNP